MKQTCPECNTIVELDESKYNEGELVLRECPVCGTEMEFSIPISPIIVNVPIQEDKNLSRIESLEREIELMKLNQRQQVQLQPLDKSDNNSVVITKAIETTIAAGKSKTTAALLAIFLGALGAHKFYLRKYLWGAIYLIGSMIGGGILFWVIAFIEGCMYLVQSNEDFNNKYNA